VVVVLHNITAKKDQNHMILLAHHQLNFHVIYLGGKNIPLEYMAQSMS